ncbi:putative signal transduction histidine kinase [Cellulomonas flavigena DSM 20109]|uniref:histidine kinase n=1 Tax=Cellulomonas flavigena (strain ATCC 482 / DSM 20109 / BCRC 11376 / JCM 18109 / NBRC 3775 / NCIMB 8073 / NRS 134) TaxID=446466 RepID=D5UJ71_CELFN|nr:ATP-binding protein [Cellulomonas flavigena]ADG73594.1 putative signal transduction histidine kinase [Cellulomonas flavigena DSM 20109]
MGAARDATQPAVRREDVVADRLTLLRGTGIIALGYALGASLQSAWIYSALVPEWAQVDLWRRLAANGIAVAGLVVALGLLGAHRAAGRVLAARVLTAALFMATLRTAVQVGLGVHPPDDTDSLVAEFVTGTIIAALSAATGVWALVSRRRMRAATRAAERQAVSVELAVRALEVEEIRVRRQVAEGLHGTVQQRLLLVDARLAGVQEQVGDLAPQVAHDLAWAREELALSREQDVRQMSRLLYPERLEMGLVPAVRALLGRLPAAIATRLRVGEALREVDDPSATGLTVADRLLAVRVVEEAVSNALKHGPPGLVEVHLDLEGDVLRVVVLNDGDPYEPPAVPDPASGTARLGERLRLVGGELRVEARAPTGARVEAVLPLGVQADEA